jgi:mono/diheme cytochrome c family protein
LLPIVEHAAYHADTGLFAPVLCCSIAVAAEISAPAGEVPIAPVAARSQRLGRCENSAASRVDPSSGGGIHVELVRCATIPFDGDLIMIRFTLALAVVLAAGAAAAQTPAQIERGQKVYAAEKCAICHSIAGVGNKRGALDGVGSRLSADEIRQWIVAAPEMTAKVKAERKPAMKAYPNIAKEDLDALVGYLQSLKK